MSTVESNTSRSQKSTTVLHGTIAGKSYFFHTATLSDEQTQEYTEAYRLFDRDADGFISQKELSLLIRSLERNPSDSEIQNFVDHLVDKDTNLIDCKQFLQMMSILEYNQTQAARKELREIFHSIDTDGSGFIDVEKLRVAMKILFPGNDDMKLTKEELEEMIHEYDRDRDGRLSMEEFLTLFDGQS